MKQFNLTAKEQTFIDSFDKKDGKYWDSECIEMKGIKRKIKQFLLSEQENRCCYCKIYKHETHGATWDIEHILPKSIYPQFMFLPENLRVSCKECNMNKGDHDVFLKSDKASKYPRTSSNITIIHPILDDYDQHIKIKEYDNGKLIHSIQKNSKKGRETFHICNFYRFSATAFGVENYYAKSIEDKFFENIGKFCPEGFSSKSADEIEKIMKFALQSATP